ncbi:MAG: RNA 2',3'-cyclic phosphodiesterase [Clostridia bacterium]|nr:RNA 2',3'-cyclic phosphodiesterase [Clostridia bacterium]
MRLFVAIPMEGAMLRAALEVQDAFRRHGVRGNYTKPENLHLTLAFIGEYPDPRAALEVIDALPFEPFELRSQGIGAFSDLWWLGFRDAPELSSCVRRLRHGLAEAGIPFDKKRFSPHVTLVRQAVCPVRGLPAVQMPDAGMTVRRIALMRSDRGRNGMIYTEIR